MKKTVILISGKLQSGKNTFAELVNNIMISKGIITKQDLFAKELKDNCKEDFNSLANYLKELAAKINASITPLFDDGKYTPSTVFNIEQTINKNLTIYDDNWYENKNPITRILLQTYGTDIFRKRVDNDWWAKKTRDRVMSYKTPIVMLTDCRFPNEIEVFTEKYSEEFKIITIRVVRNINTNVDIASHDSETALDDWKEWTYIVDNNGTIEDLKQSATVITEEILNGNFEI